jgi:hypothetical protein
VTSAAFADLNGDGWPDLVVAGEWMGVDVYYNHKGVFAGQEIVGSSGLWQTVVIADVNGDGYPDILAGNWGLNSKLSAGKDGPLKLYVKDFASSGTTGQVLTYTIGGVEYPFLGKDQLELALPVLKKTHLRYDEVAGKSVQYLLGDLLEGSRVFTADRLASTCFFGDGEGGFVPVELPRSLQLSPVFGFVSVDSMDWLAAGNFYGVQPFEGRYDAMAPTIFACDKGTRQIRYVDDLPAMGGEFRDAKWMRGANGRKMLVLARNNAGLVFLRPGLKNPGSDPGPRF